MLASHSVLGCVCNGAGAQQCWRMRHAACNHAEVSDPLTEVLEARKAYEQARADAKKLVDRARARLGLSIVQARRSGKSQTAVMESMGKSREQVRAFEQAYKDWLRDHKGEPLD